MEPEMNGHWEELRNETTTRYGVGSAVQLDRVRETINECSATEGKIGNAYMNH